MLVLCSMDASGNVPPLRVCAGLSPAQSEIGLGVLAHAVCKSETQDAGSTECLAECDLHEERTKLFSVQLGNFLLDFERLVII